MGFDQVEAATTPSRKSSSWLDRTRPRSGSSTPISEAHSTRISHDYLQKAIGLVPGRELIKQWLKAGYVEQEMLHATEQGTPQGGVISPLLANIALHGMEEAIGVKYDYRGQIVGKRAVVRYADDFVCFCETKEDARVVQGILSEWLKERGLILSEEKTRIVHLTEGFDFLGFVRHESCTCGCCG